MHDALLLVCRFLLAHLLILAIPSILASHSFSELSVTCQSNSRK